MAAAMKKMLRNYSRCTFECRLLVFGKAGNIVSELVHVFILTSRYQQETVLQLVTLGKRGGFGLGFDFLNTGLCFFLHCLYSLVALFQLVTLPVEFDASSRAMAVLESSGILNQDELKASRKVLTAAAMTYVAALLTSLLTLLRLLILANGRRR